MFNKEKPVEVIFDTDKCVKCGMCAKICPSEYIVFENDELNINHDTFMGCIQCGHCMMVCPKDAVAVKGEGISPEDLIEIDKNQIDFEQLQNLLLKRRSTRHFKNQPIPEEIINKILDAASTGAISLPPYEVKVLVINGGNKVQELARDIVNAYKKMIKVMNPFTVKLFKFFMAKGEYKVFKDFILPLINWTIGYREQGRDILFYNAPAVLVFTTTEIGDDQDAVIASTNAMLAAEALGLGTCVIGGVPPALNRNPKLREKYGILKGEKAVLAMILGYPEIKFKKAIKRRFKQVRHY